VGFTSNFIKMLGASRNGNYFAPLLLLLLLRQQRAHTIVDAAHAGTRPANVSGMLVVARYH
jgi:hypothetical protein